MDLNSLFEIVNLDKRVSPDLGMKTVWSGVVKTPSGKEVPFSCTGHKPSIMKALRSANIKIEIFYLESGHVVVREIEMSELQKLSFDVGVRFDGKLLGFHRCKRQQ